MGGMFSSNSDNTQKYLVSFSNEEYNEYNAINVLNYYDTIKKTKETTLIFKNNIIALNWACFLIECLLKIHEVNPNTVSINMNYDITYTGKIVIIKCYDCDSSSSHFSCMNDIYRDFFEKNMIIIDSNNRHYIPNTVFDRIALLISMEKYKTKDFDELKTKLKTVCNTTTNNEQCNSDYLELEKQNGGYMTNKLNYLRLKNM